MPTTVRLNNGLSLRTRNLQLAMNGNFAGATRLELSKFSEAWNAIKSFFGFQTDQDKVEKLVIDLQNINTLDTEHSVSEYKTKLTIFKEIVEHVNKEDQERFTVEITPHCNGGIGGTVQFLLRGKDEENIELHSMEVADIYKFVRCDLKETRKNTANPYLHYGTVYVLEPSDIKIKCKIIADSTNTTINPEVTKFCNNVNKTSDLFTNNKDISEDMVPYCNNFNEQFAINWDDKTVQHQFRVDTMPSSQGNRGRGVLWNNCNGDKNYLQNLWSIGSKKLTGEKVTKEDTLMACATIQTINASAYAAIMPHQLGGSDVDASCNVSANSRKPIGFEYNREENTMVITSNVEVISNTIITSHNGGLDFKPTGKELCTTRETYKILNFTDREITLQCVEMNIYQQKQELLI